MNISSPSAPGRGVENLQKLQGFRFHPGFAALSERTLLLLRSKAVLLPLASYLSVWTPVFTLSDVFNSKTPKRKNSRAVIYSINTVELLLYSRQGSRVTAAISAPLGR